MTILIHTGREEVVAFDLHLLFQIQAQPQQSKTTYSSDMCAFTSLKYCHQLSNPLAFLFFLFLFLFLFHLFFYFFYF